MNIQGLKAIEKLLLKVPPEVFSIREWVTEETEEDFNGKFDCGFAGCAIGWAAHAKVVKGLTLKNSCEPLYIDKHGDYYSHNVAVKLALGLNNSQLYYLFMPSAYEDEPFPIDVAERIHKFIESNGAIS